MEQGKNRCCTCRCFNAYYTRSYCSLFKENNGYCSRQNKVMQKNDGCDKWQCRRVIKEKRLRLALNAIPDIYNKLAVLEQFLKEESELRGSINISDKIDT